ncbi:MAG: hypothetical protein DMH00_12910 [Acidobacteria bacterium]|nr:MAG: hypothetical protein DMH00_12910 [Acidobacteriota bacterium]
MDNMLEAARDHRRRKMGPRALRWIFWAGATLLLILIPSAVSAGSIKLVWDPVADPDLAGYKVYYGTTSGIYTNATTVGTQNNAKLNNLQDCQVYFIAVKAVDANGNESVAFSNELSGMAAPSNSSVTPKSGKQATNSLNVTITGSNFDTQARPDFGPDVVVNSFSTSSCHNMTANITIAEAARVNSPPALPRLLSVTNPGGASGSASGVFEVTFNERRADIDKSGRVGGRDLLYWQNAFGSTSGDLNYNVDADMNGDGIVDGADLTLLAVWHGHIFF